MIIFLWRVKVNKQSCIFDSFKEAYEDYKTHDNALIYPIFMSKAKYKSLPEHIGW